MSILSGYGKVHSLGHREVANIFTEPVWAEEKIDGSQFSFGVVDGELRCRSRGQEQSLDRADGMFLEAIAVAKSLESLLVPGWTYRGEYLRTPRHNVLAYERIPENHIILFDVQQESGELLTVSERDAEALRLGLESVPVLFEGTISGTEDIAKLLDRISILGGQKIEGVVFKRGAMKAKHVSERFKEVQRPGYKAREPKTDAITQVAESLRTVARWEKAVQHLRDEGQIAGEPKDIGPLMRELAHDLTEECEDLIKEKLFALAKKDIVRIVSRGFPEWYKERLAASQFEEGGSK